MRRIVQPELLDELPGTHPDAIRSRKDLKRVNWWMGNARWLAGMLTERMEEQPRKIIELGTGDGSLMLECARRLRKKWVEPVELTLLDRQDLVNEETRKDFEAMGWQVRVIKQDLMEWMRDSGPDRYDFIVANLFLHHFEETILKDLFESCRQISKAIVCCEPRRWWISLFATRFLFLIGCNAVTRHDARLSVRAGFRDQELSELWGATQEYHIVEKPVGFASHLFFAEEKS